MLGVRQVRLDRLFGAGRRFRLRKRRDLQNFVDRGGLGLRLGESIALRQGRHFVGVDPVDQPIEVLAHPRVGAGAVGRFQQDVNGPVELDPRAIEMTHLQLALAGVEMCLRLCDKGENGVLWGWSGGRHWRHWRGGRGRDRRTLLDLRIGAARSYAARRVPCRRSSARTTEHDWTCWALPRGHPSARRWSNAR